MFHNVLPVEPEITYGTRGDAEHALFAALSSAPGILNYLIATTRDGHRYFPVFLAAPEQIDLAMLLAESGFAAVRVLTLATLTDE